MQFNNNDESMRKYQELMQAYYEENPCFNGESHDNSIIEELMKYRAGVVSSDCEMGG